MKILVTLDFPPETGGIQRYLHDIVMHTFSREDLVITGGTDKKSNESDCRYPCRIQRIRFCGDSINKKIRLAPFLLRVMRLVIKNQKCVVIAGNLYAAVVPWLVSRFISLDYEVYCYGTELLPIKKNSLRTKLWKAVLNKAGAVYYLTAATRLLLEEGYSCRHCTQWVPRIDLPRFDLSSKRRCRENVQLISVGRLVPHKGHAVLVDAAAMLGSEPDWHLTIVGKGPEYARLVALVRQRSLENRVTIHTSVSSEELPVLYQQADIFVLPSIASPSAIEGFGIVLLEAMAYGAALIASRSGGIEEVVEGNAAYAELVPSGDSEALSRAMRRLISDRERRCRMANAARAFLEERYVWR